MRLEDGRGKTGTLQRLRQDAGASCGVVMAPGQNQRKRTDSNRNGAVQIRLSFLRRRVTETWREVGEGPSCGANVTPRPSSIGRRKGRPQSSGRLRGQRWRQRGRERIGRKVASSRLLGRVTFAAAAAWPRAIPSRASRRGRERALIAPAAVATSGAQTSGAVGCSVIVNEARRRADGRNVAAAARMAWRSDCSHETRSEEEGVGRGSAACRPEESFPEGERTRKGRLGRRRDELSGEVKSLAGRATWPGPATSWPSNKCAFASVASAAAPWPDPDDGR